MVNSGVSSARSISHLCKIKGSRFQLEYLTAFFMMLRPYAEVDDGGRSPYTMAIISAPASSAGRASLRSH